MKKKKRLRYTPILVRFGETEAASDFGSVCLTEAKSEVHTEVHPYGLRSLSTEIYLLKIRKNENYFFSTLLERDFVLNFEICKPCESWLSQILLG
jgi:hypothetical protein